MRANKYRIYPTSEQRELLQKHFGHVRHVYNWALAEKDKHYKETGKSLNRADLQRMLVASKKTDKPWLSEVNSQSLLASLLNLDTAFTNFFKGRAKFPKTKKKYSGWQSFQCPQHVSIDFEKGLINLPKIKGIKAKIHRAGLGKIKTVTINMKIGRFQPSSKTCFHCGFKMEKMPLSVRQWDCPSCGTKSICRDTNAARMIAKFAIADSLGHSDCVKCSHISMLVSASDISKGDSLCRHESQEAPTIADLSA